MTTALMRAKIAVATSALALSVLHPGDHPRAAVPPVAAEPRTVSMAVELAASITSDGSSQTVGVADAYLYTLTQTELVAQLSEIRSLGVTDLRIVVPWIYIQPLNSTSYNWSQMDNVINTAHAMGFSMTASITMNPSWDGTPLVGAPNPGTYATFAAAVAQRYGSQISAYEVWNEPNTIESLAPADPGAYTAMLKAAYTAIKSVAPSATVIAGVLGAVATVPGLSLAPQQFLAGMYAAGAQGFFDALSFHPYNYTLPFSAGAGVANSPLEQVQALYALMVANGDAAKQIWASEYGNATTPGGIDQTQQAQLLRDFVTAWSKLPFAGPAFVYTANDLNTGYLLDENNFGLFTTDGVPKLAAQTLATLVSELASGTLPNYTAPGMSVPQTIWIQLVSTAVAVVNEALLVPNVVTGIVYNAAPPVLQQAFSIVAHAVSMAAAQTLNAITPVAEAGIGLLVNFPTSVNAAAATLGANFYGTELTVQRALASIGIGAAPNPAPPAPAPAATATAVPAAKPAAETTGPTSPPKPASAAVSGPVAADNASAAKDSAATSTAPTTVSVVHDITPAATTPTVTTPTTPAKSQTAPAVTAADGATATKTAPAATPKSAGAPATSAPPKTTTDTSANDRAPSNSIGSTKSVSPTSDGAGHPTSTIGAKGAHHDGESATTGKHSASAGD